MVKKLKLQSSKSLICVFITQVYYLTIENTYLITTVSNHFQSIWSLTGVYLYGDNGMRNAWCLMLRKIYFQEKRIDLQFIVLLNCILKSFKLLYKNMYHILSYIYMYQFSEVLPSCKNCHLNYSRSVHLDRTSRRARVMKKTWRRTLCSIL